MLMRTLANLLALTLLSVAGPTLADSVEGPVVEVSDGATLTVHDKVRGRVTVRLAGIDAPAAGQPYGRESRQHLSDLTRDRTVRVEWRKSDERGRLLGKVVLRAVDCADCPKTRDAGLAQLEAGLAWWQRDYRRQQSLEDQGYYEYAEFDAKARRIGLWQDPAPIPPWEWRKRNQIRAGNPTVGRPQTEVCSMVWASLPRS